jgi:DNA-binding NtrC family response regulator
MKKLLIVDDTAEYAEALRNVLRNEYEVVLAHSLAEAQRTADDTISLFLVDIRLDEADPDNTDGLDFLDWIKARYKDKPVVVMSAFKEFEERKDTITSRGASAFLKKPIDTFNLRQTLARLAAD